MSIFSAFIYAHIGLTNNVRLCSNRYPWFDTRFSYNPAIHRTKQALFHSAVVQDLASNPPPPPHPELLKYFEPPKKVLKRARDALEECKAVFKVKEGGFSTLVLRTYCRFD